MKAEIQFIGKVHSALNKIGDCPLQENESAPEAGIFIFPEFKKGILEISAGSEMLLFTWLHKADRSVITCKPRNNPDAPQTGVFSTRSPDRPNPIGMHLVKVVSVAADGLIKVAALEVLDQTPVIDIKPVLNK